ncbi:acyl-homoserine-lactone synthase [Serratia plymuthica]|uniref:acyl-homoserine-lactone synthase n=1 Tax=Serratia plymuthica TaxID=82996 RepID=UPI0007EB16A5|nr:acyl-homoserine-lactone synthase [Serratia plymuthica]ANJ93438.1 acyl-homoserine-lactone synthase [Serratia plymuthica]
MIEIFDVNYNLMSDNRSKELFSLRKKTFKDRLDWIVKCENNMEFDDYDSEHATYLFGTYKEIVVCSLRFIEIKYPNMITGTFKSYFNKIELPEGNFVEASRLFIDKERVQAMQLQKKPISSILFLSMINYARNYGYQGIYAIISHPMLIIFQRSGWEISVIEQGQSEKNQRIYLIYMPVDDRNQQILIDRISLAHSGLTPVRDVWPLTFRVRDHGPDELKLNS